MALADNLYAFGNRGGLLSRIEQNRGVQVANDLNQYRLGAAQREEQKLNTLGELYSKARAGDTAAVDAMARLDPKFAMGVETHQAGLQKEQQAQQTQQQEQVARQAIWANSPEKWQSTPFAQQGIPFEQRDAVIGQFIGNEGTFKAVQDMNKRPDSVAKLEYLMSNPQAMAAEQSLRRSGATTINNIPKPDFGYVYNDPTDPSKGVAVVPGSKPDVERQKADEARQNKLANITSSSANTLDAISEAKKLVSGISTGIPGAVMGNIPTTSAYQLESTIQTIKANIGFDRLQAMRDASPTGGALGQVAIQELTALQASIANLDPKQGAERLMKNLEKIERHYNNWLSTVQQSEGGAQGQATQETPAQTGGVRFLGFE